MPNTRPQCTSVPGMVPIMLAAPISRRRRLVEACRIAHRPLDQVVEQGERDIDQQQAGDRLVDAALVTQRAGQRDPQRRRRSCRRAAIASCTTERRRIRQQQRRRSGGERRRSRSAPSPPMIIEPSCAGSAVHSAVRISGAARVSVFCSENQEPNEPWYM